MGVASQNMPTQQYANTKNISFERYQVLVSIMLRYMDEIKAFSENLSCREVKIYIILEVAYQNLLSNATSFYKYSDNKRIVQRKHISLLRKFKKV